MDNESPQKEKMLPNPLDKKELPPPEDVLIQSEITSKNKSPISQINNQQIPNNTTHQNNNALFPQKKLNQKIIIIFLIFILFIFTAIAAIYIKKTASNLRLMNFQNSPKITPGKKSLDQYIMIWKEYKNDDYGISFKYPKDFIVEEHSVVKNGSLQNYTEFKSKDNNGYLAIRKWKKSNIELTDQTVEKWCRLLGNEAKENQLTCSLFSPRVITPQIIKEKLVYTITYSTSFREQIEIYVIPFEQEILTIHLVALINEQYQDTISKLKQIISTISFLDEHAFFRTCIPRPICLDQNPPCALPETMNLCTTAASPSMILNKQY